VQLLLRCGALVSVHDAVTQRTPVHAAVANGHKECLLLLLENTEESHVVDSVDYKKRSGQKHSSLLILLLELFPSIEPFQLKSRSFRTCCSPVSLGEAGFLLHVSSQIRQDKACSGLRILFLVSPCSSSRFLPSSIVISDFLQHFSLNHTSTSLCMSQSSDIMLASMLRCTGFKCWLF
jgi:hypothetical protein